MVLHEVTLRTLCDDQVEEMKDICHLYERNQFAFARLWSVTDDLLLPYLTGYMDFIYKGDETKTSF